MKNQPAWIATLTLVGFCLFSVLPSAAQATAGSLLPDATYTAVAADQHSGAALGSPFPMAANPAIESRSEQEELPSAMSSNLSRSDHGYELGSPFPMAADPAIREGHNKLEGVDEGADFSRGSAFADTASPFPTAASPARSSAW